MKFILSFLFIFVFLSPSFAIIAEDCSPYTTDAATCSNQPGCYWDEFDDIPCRKCPTGFACVNGEQTQCTNTLGAHQQHPLGASECSDFICTDGWVSNGSYCTPNCTGISEPKFLPAGEENCDNWKCRENYYRGGASNDNCLTCPTNANTCSQGTDTTTVTCQTGFIKSITNGVVTCSTCPEHAEQSGNTCVCSIGYYGDGNSSCTACPAGTTTSSTGATSDADCHMTSNTQFCDVNGENCLNLIPDNATNIQ
jgi:hypothetical protein